VAVVTGASGLIGAQVTEGLTHSGYCVVLGYHKKRNAIDALQLRLSARGALTSVVQVDVTQAQQVKGMVDHCIHEWGRLDLLVNCAGVIRCRLFPMISLEEWNQVVSVNLTGTFLCSKAVSKQMILARRGHIINIASPQAHFATQGAAHYSASKAGVIAFSRCIAKELGAFNIRVNVVCPGSVKESDTHESDVFLAARRQSVLGRLGSISDIAGCICWLASDSAESISGQVFTVDSRVPQ
jgi:3-oxoacyl-[acyl-carrier protein] reductase